MKIAGYKVFRIAEKPSMLPAKDLLPCGHAVESKAWGTHVCVRKGPGNERTCSAPSLCPNYTRETLEKTTP